MHASFLLEFSMALIVLALEEGYSFDYYDQATPSMVVGTTVDAKQS
jgi:hypothetical protein